MNESSPLDLLIRGCIALTSDPGDAGYRRRRDRNSRRPPRADRQSRRGSEDRGPPRDRCTRTPCHARFRQCAHTCGAIARARHDRGYGLRAGLHARRPARLRHHRGRSDRARPRHRARSHAVRLDHHQRHVRPRACDLAGDRRAWAAYLVVRLDPRCRFHAGSQQGVELRPQDRRGPVALWDRPVRPLERRVRRAAPA